MAIHVDPRAESVAQARTRHEQNRNLPAEVKRRLPMTFSVMAVRR